MAYFVIMEKKKPKNIQQLESERKQKLFFNEFKKWSFEDYQKYEKKRKFADNLFKLFFLICYVGLIYAIILGFLFSWSVEKIVARDNVLVNEAEKKCKEINQTFMNSELLYNQEALLVKCSENNLVIGGKE